MQLPLFLRRFPYSYRGFMCQERKRGTFGLLQKIVGLKLAVSSTRRWHLSLSFVLSPSFFFYFFFLWNLTNENRSLYSRRARLTIMFVEKLDRRTVSLFTVCFVPRGFLLVIPGILTSVHLSWISFDMQDARKYFASLVEYLRHISLPLGIFVYFPRARSLCRARKPLFDHWIIQIRRLDPRTKITAGQNANKRVCHLRSTCFTLCAASISRIFSLASPTDFMRSILRRKNDLPVYFSLWNSLAEVCFWRSNATEICENRFIDLVFV